MKDIEFFFSNMPTKKRLNRGAWVVYSSQMVGAFNSTKILMPYVKAHVWNIENVFNEGDAETILQNNIVKISEYAWNGPSKEGCTIFAIAIMHGWNKYTNVLRASFIATDIPPNIPDAIKIKDVRDIKLLSA